MSAPNLGFEVVEGDGLPCCRAWMIVAMSDVGSQRNRPQLAASGSPHPAALSG